MDRYNILLLSDRESWIAPYIKEFMNCLHDEGHAVIVTDEFP